MPFARRLWAPALLLSALPFPAVASAQSESAQSTVPSAFSAVAGSLSDHSAVVVDPTSLMVDEGDSGSYGVRLASEPTGTVTVELWRSSYAVRLNEVSLTFTPQNWNTPQAVSVLAAVDDDAVDGSVIMTRVVRGGGYGKLQPNRRLREEIDALKIELAAREAHDATIDAPASGKPAAGFARVDPEYGYEILDPTTNINRKQRLVLERKRDGTLAPDTLHVQGAVTAIANHQSSNRDDKFGYLMRHPTASNQVGGTVSEATIHSAQLGFTGTLGRWLTGHAEMLFDPEQSFGTGTNTDLERNQVQVRRAYALFGDLERSPFHASLGKMDVPFGLTDTVSPFTASTVWHAFGGLANGVTVGYVSEGLNVSVMGVQGGAQFRAANTPVEGTAVPSRLNNFAVDLHYDFAPGSAVSLLLGGSYIRGTAYCQDYPVQHFLPCRDNNPGADVYGRLVYGDLIFKAEFAQTTDEWPGTFNPNIPQFAASKVTSFDFGVRRRFSSGRGPVDVSAEFSRFDAGPDGAPWEQQDQIVLGGAWFVRPGAKLFAEYIRVNGYAPLNFISGGSVKDEDGEVTHNRIHSDRSARSARSDIIMVGVIVAF